MIQLRISKEIGVGKENSTHEEILLREKLYVIRMAQEVEKVIGMMTRKTLTPLRNVREESSASSAAFHTAFNAYNPSNKTFSEASIASSASSISTSSHESDVEEECEDQDMSPKSRMYAYTA